MPRRTKRWLLLLVALGLIARLVRYAVGFPIWGDESFVACNFLTRDLHGLLSQPLEFEMVVPLGWLVPTHLLSSWLGPEPWVLRRMVQRRQKSATTGPPPMPSSR